MAQFKLNIYALVFLVGFSTVSQVFVKSEEDSNTSTDSNSELETTTLSNNIDEMEETTSKEELLQNQVKMLTEQVANLVENNTRLAEETKQLREQLKNNEQNTTLVEETPQLGEKLDDEQNNITLVGESTTSSPVEAFSVFACEYTDLSIRCPKGIIHILGAMYGRISQEICSKESASIKTDFPNLLLQSNCTGRDSDFSTVKTKCESQVACSVSATNVVFGDPCGWTYKYLEVDYECLESS